MTRTSKDAGDTIECGIGVREVLAGDGSVKRRLTVHCSPRGEGVEVATCAVCARCVEVRLPAQGLRGFVLCHRLATDAAESTTDPGLRTPVSAVMERDIVCVLPEVTVEAVAALLLEWGVSGIPVVDESGHPIGMISSTDLLREHREFSGRATAEAVAEVGGDPTRPATTSVRPTAGAVMTPLVFSVVEDTALCRAAALMSTEGFHQVPVVLGDGSVGGLLSTRDVTRWVAQSERPPK